MVRAVTPCWYGQLRAGDDEQAFAGALRLVQRLVGKPEQRLRVLGVRRAQGEAKARGETFELRIPVGPSSASIA